MSPDGEALRELAVRLARSAAEVLLEHRQAPVTVTHTKTSPTDVVTAADVAAEHRLRELLRRARPDDGVLGEEEGLRPGRSGLTWVVDPLDGTANYLYGIGVYAVSVAVVQGSADPSSWHTVAGAVHDVERGQTYSAAAGGGARLDGPLPWGGAADGSPLAASACTRLGECLLGTGYSYEPAVREVQGRALATLLPQVRDVRRIGSAALDLCMVAAGRFDGYVERGLHPWDHAAGVLVAREAGAAVRGVAGRAPDHDLVLAAAPGVVDELSRAVELSGYLGTHRGRER